MRQQQQQQQQREEKLQQPHVPPPPVVDYQSSQVPKSQNNRLERLKTQELKELIKLKEMERRKLEIEAEIAREKAHLAELQRKEFTRPEPLKANNNKPLSTHGPSHGSGHGPAQGPAHGPAQGPAHSTSIDFDKIRCKEIEEEIAREKAHLAELQKLEFARPEPVKANINKPKVNCILISRIFFFGNILIILISRIFLGCDPI